MIIFFSDVGKSIVLLLFVIGLIFVREHPFNTSLLIFLGKQYLGQSDRNELELVGNLENILKECGYEDSPIEKKSIKQSETVEEPRVLA